jgi:hypothetical protein
MSLYLQPDPRGLRGSTSGEANIIPWGWLWFDHALGGRLWLFYDASIPYDPGSRGNSTHTFIDLVTKILTFYLWNMFPS